MINLHNLQICKANFSCPLWFSSGAKKLIKRILDPNPHTVGINCISKSFCFYIMLLFYLVESNLFLIFMSLCDFGRTLISLDTLSCHRNVFLHSCICLQRITIPEILEDEWFKRGYKPPSFEQGEDVSLDDVESVFNDSQVMSIHM